MREMGSRRALGTQCISEGTGGQRGAWFNHPETDPKTVDQEHNHDYLLTMLFLRLSSTLNQGYAIVHVCPLLGPGFLTKTSI